MTGKEYQRACMRTANGMDYQHYDRLVNGVLGLNGEAGEVTDLVKKFLFQGHDLDKERIEEETGDCLWYCALIADAIGSDLDVIMEKNVAKLWQRYPEGFDAERSIHREEEA